MREKLEPLREGEERIEKDSSTVLNYQAELDDSQGEWKIKQLSPELIQECRDYQGSRVLLPTVWTREFRSAPCERLESARPLRRSDSSTLLSWTDSGGGVHSFLAKPLLLA